MAKSEMTHNGTPQKKYSCIFFDLDHTLWDYESNSCDTLNELYTQYNLKERGVTSCENLNTQFRLVNNKLWDLFDRGKITSDVIRKERFPQILAAFQIRDEKLCADLAHDYITECPKKGKLMPHAIETLDYLSQYYDMSVITNGFEEIQHCKLKAGSLTSYFDHIITSERAGNRKPSCEIFNFALSCHGIKNHQAIMIGDNLITDIGGACNAYIDAVFFNPEKNAHEGHYMREIHSLAELQGFL